jgi:hypothetical protein
MLSGGTPDRSMQTPGFQILMANRIIQPGSFLSDQKHCRFDVFFFFPLSQNGDSSEAAADKTRWARPMTVRFFFLGYTEEYTTSSRTQIRIMISEALDPMGLYSLRTVRRIRTISSRGLAAIRPRYALATVQQDDFV